MQPRTDEIATGQRLRAQVRQWPRFGYRRLTQMLQRGLRLGTGLRKNMQEQLLLIWDKLLLRKRSLIKSVIAQLKNISQIQHTRPHSPADYLVNILAGLVADTHQPKKPSLHLTLGEIQQMEQQAVPQLKVS